MKNDRFQVINMRLKKRGLTALLLAGVLTLSSGCSMPDLPFLNIHNHTPGAPATCAAPQVCTKCGEILSPQLQHTPGELANCAHPQNCTECGEILVPVTEHVPGAPATCKAPQVCVVCGAELAPAGGHAAEGVATCTEPLVCSVCGELIAEAAGHVPKEGACTEPVLCASCGETLGEPKGHTPSETADCSKPITCTVCGAELSGGQARHTVDDSGVCTLCNQQVLPEGLTVRQPGAGSAMTDDETGLVPETEASGHYNNTCDAYYSDSVLICGDYGMEYSDPSTEGDADWAAAINAFAGKYPELNTTALLTPKCTAFYTPAGEYDPYDDTVAFIRSTYDMLSEGIKRADCIGEMSEHRGEYMFYRSDHHWTSLGAYYASVAYCRANDITPNALDTYETAVRTDVIGTLYTFSGDDENLASNPDYTVCHYPHAAYTMECGSYGALWEGEALDSEYRDYAGAFLQGDSPLTVIHTSNTTGRALLVFKESYGNAFVPYMIDYYDTIVALDVRESGGSTAALIEEYGITDALFINNIPAAISLSDTIAERCMD